MGSIIIKMNNQFYLKDKDINNLIQYIAGKSANKEEVRYINGRGLPKKYDKAAECIIKMQKYYKKANKRRIYHFVVSFSEDVTDANYVKIVAENVADMIFLRYQVYYGVHEDTDNLHIHFAVNAVSYVDGKKWHQSRDEFMYMKNEILKICEKVKKEFI